MPTLHAAGTVWWAAVALLGLTVGLVAGMFGVGGGFMLVPLLNITFGVPMEVAAGTGLCQMIGTAVAAFRRHSRLQQGEPKLDWMMLGGALMGVQAGALALTALAHLGTVTVAGHRVVAVKLWVSSIYVVLLGATSAWMLYDSRTRPAGAPLKPGPLARLRIPPVTLLPRSGRRVSVLVIALLGLAMGFLSGLIGIGGGVALMPVLIYGLGMRIRMAAGTGILMLLATSLLGTWAHALLGHVHLGLAMTLLAGSTLGAPVGATITSRVAGHRLRATFAYVVLVTAVAVLWDLLRVIRLG